MNKEASGIIHLKIFEFSNFQELLDVNCSVFRGWKARVVRVGERQEFVQHVLNGALYRRERETPLQERPPG